EAEPLAQRYLRPAPPRALDQQPGAEEREGDDQGARAHDVPSVQVPQRGVLVSHDAPGREPARAETPAPELALVEHVRGAAPFDDGKRPRPLTPEDSHRQLGRPRALAHEAGEAPAHDPVSQMGLRPAVHRYTRSAGDERHGLRIGEEASRLIP